MKGIRIIIARLGFSLRNLSLLIRGYRYYRVYFIGLRREGDAFAHVYVSFEGVRRSSGRAVADAEKAIRESDAFKECMEYKIVGVEKSADVFFCHPEDFLISKSDVGDAESPCTLFSTLDEYERATVDSIGMEGTCWQAL